MKLGLLLFLISASLPASSSDRDESAGESKDQTFQEARCKSLCAGTPVAEASEFSFEAFERQAAAVYPTYEALLRASLGPPLLGLGLGSAVREIPHLRSFCLRMSRAVHQELLRGNFPDGHHLIRELDYAQDENFGQAIASLGPIQVIKRQRGLPMGMKRFIAANDAEGLRAAQLAYRERLSEAARLPQTAYIDLARQYKKMFMLRARPDLGKADNLLIDIEREAFGFVDVRPPGDVADVQRVAQFLVPEARSHAEVLLNQIIMGSVPPEAFTKIDLAEMLVSLMDNTHARHLKPTPQIIADRQEILRKLALAAHFEGFAFAPNPNSTLRYSFEIAQIATDPKTYFREVVKADQASKYSK